MVNESEKETQGTGPQEIGPQEPLSSNGWSVLDGAQGDGNVEHRTRNDEHRGDGDSDPSTLEVPCSTFDFPSVDPETQLAGQPPLTSAALNATDAPSDSPPESPLVCIDPDVEFTTCMVGGVTAVRCVHAGTGQHFQFGTAEHHIAQLLDGNRGVAEIIQGAGEAGLEWTPKDVAEFIAMLVAQKLAITVAAKSDGAEARENTDSRLPDSSSQGFPTTQSTEALLDQPLPTEQGEVESSEARFGRGSASDVDLAPMLVPSPEKLAEGSFPDPSRCCGRGSSNVAQPPSDGEPLPPDSPFPASDREVGAEGQSQPGQSQPPTSRESLVTRCITAVKQLTPALMKLCSYAISLRFPLLVANPLAERVLPIVRPVIAGRGVIAACVFICISMAFAIYHQGSLTDELMRIFHSKLGLFMIGGWVVLKVIHELGHACLAKQQNVQVGKAGIMFFMFAPIAYVDVTNAWKLKSRSARVSIALGGVYFELICASVAVWVWWWCPGGLVAHLAAQVFFLAGPATLLVNANPLLRLDGYYVVSDLVDVPNLREQGRRLLGGAIERKLFGMTGPKTHLNGWRRTFAVWHAAASVLFQFVWMAGLVVVVSMWAGPIGLLVAGCAVFLWTVVPSVRWCHKLWTYQEETEGFSVGSHRRKMLWTVLTIATVMQFFITLPSPMVIEVPAVTRFSQDQVLRSPANGFVRQVFFQTGQTVRAGEVILQLENEEVEVQRDEILLQLQSEKIQWQLHERANALGLAEASSRKSESLQRKLAELEEQVAAMSVKAIEDGEILTPHLIEMSDRFVTHGSELVQTGNRNRKELLLSIGEVEMDAYKEAVQRGYELRVCLRGGQWVDVIPQPMRPRGSKSVPHPALAATAGGPIPVAPAESENGQRDSIEFLSPRFEAIVRLAPGQSDLVRCGEVGHLALQDKRSLARRFWVWMTDGGL